MGIKTETNYDPQTTYALKNLPTTWGLRLKTKLFRWIVISALKNLPTTWGLRLTFSLKLL